MAREQEQRKLTEVEQKRLERFNAICDNLAEQGYARTDLIISIFRASVFSIVMMVVLAAVCLPLFNVVNPQAEAFIYGTKLIVVLIAIVALTVVHELIHGFVWSRFSAHGFKDIEFGIMMNSLSPYCTCGVPLERGPYMLGTLAPLVILGIVPLVAAFPLASVELLYTGIFMVVGAAGDIMIAAKLMSHTSASTDVLLYDHPTEAGSVIFER